MRTEADMILTLAEVTQREPNYLASIFTLANGRVGVQAQSPVGEPINQGTLVNGFYEISPIVYGETAVGYPKDHQTIVNLPNLRQLSLKTSENHPFTTAHLTNAKLNLQTGELMEWYDAVTAFDEMIKLKLVTVMDHEAETTYAMKLVLSAGTYHGDVVVDKRLDYLTTEKQVASTDPRQSRHLSTLTTQKRWLAADREQLAVVATLSERSVLLQQSVHDGAHLHGQRVNVAKPATLVYTTQISEVGGSQPPKITRQPGSYDEVAAAAKRYWEQVWTTATVTVGGAPALNRIIHYDLFQLNQAAPRGGQTSIPAKGLTGSGYEGHYFWDTEMYMLPYFIHTQSAVAKDLLMYRYRLLKTARHRARELGVTAGALFSWRTIGGEETSAFFPAGTAQYHINAAIALSVWRYYEGTNDLGFLETAGFEMVLETARFWREFGSWATTHGHRQFELWTVTGPDEYTAMVNNNYYTNRCAKENLRLVHQIARLITERGHHNLADYGTDWEEVNELLAIANAMYLPYDQQRKINAQDDDFLDKPRWPVKTMATNQRPLLRYYHPLVIYRYQVAKQADTLMAEYLFEGDVSLAQVQREFTYYEGVTTHDSSLSRSIFGIIAARLGDRKEVMTYLKHTAQLDLANLQHNTADGLHEANFGGTWLTLTNGLAGLTVTDGVVTVQNRLPTELTDLTFRLQVGASLLEIQLTHEATTAVLLAGPSCWVNLDGTKRLMSEPVVVEQSA
ncbi:glycoside hydrolase family 65 protein [Furfurilactobacillus entadae]|uniref:glycoside hydrolase family 65 protein n=1 Tax=Furfurilactobacillus entadae TaxID=2922307 RepID=UPI0035EB1775